jgi:hypothetical protein
MNVVAQSVLTPRSKTITGIPEAQAVSTAGVRVAVVEGEMMRASHSPESTNAWMSEICWSSSSPASEVRNSPISPASWRTFTCSCMVIQPVTRQGLETEALEKHTVASPPSRVNSPVSTHSGSIACSQGVAGSPSGAMSRWASWASYSDWTNHSSPEPSVVASSAGSVGVSVVQPVARSSPRAAAAARARRVVCMVRNLLLMRERQ